MAKVLTCDICRKPTDKIVGKLMYVPYTGTRYSYSDYEALADVGECCEQTLQRMVRFRRRKRRVKEAEPVV
jgi:hypothetical protein